MTAESGVVRTPLDVNGEFMLSGVAERGGVVRLGAVLWLSGVMKGRLVVEHGARVKVSGVFDGQLYNDGQVIVSGVFGGLVEHNEGEILARVGSVFKRGTTSLVVTPDGSLGNPPSRGWTTVIDDQTPLCRLVGDHFEPI